MIEEEDCEEDYAECLERLLVSLDNCETRSLDTENALGVLAISMKILTSFFIEKELHQIKNSKE
jgi:hypothetical protein